MMRRVLLHPSTLVFAVLVAATLLSVLAAEASLSAPWAAGVVVLIGTLKIRLVFVRFMELERSVVPWRIVFEVWILAVTLVILGTYCHSARLLS